MFHYGQFQNIFKISNFSLGPQVTSIIGHRTGISSNDEKTQKNEKNGKNQSLESDYYYIHLSSNLSKVRKGE